MKFDYLALKHNVERELINSISSHNQPYALGYSDNVTKPRQGYLDAFTGLLCSVANEELDVLSKYMEDKTDKRLIRINQLDSVRGTLKVDFDISSDIIMLSGRDGSQDAFISMDFLQSSVIGKHQDKVPEDIKALKDMKFENGITAVLANDITLLDMRWQITGEDPKPEHIKSIANKLLAIPRQSITKILNNSCNIASDMAKVITGKDLNKYADKSAVAVRIAMKMLEK